MLIRMQKESAEGVMVSSSRKEMNLIFATIAINLFKKYI